MTFRDLKRLIARHPRPDDEATPEAVLALLREDPPGSNPEAVAVREAKARLGLSYPEMAGALGVSEMTVIRWAMGDVVPDASWLAEIRAMGDPGWAGPPARPGRALPVRAGDGRWTK